MGNELIELQNTAASEIDDAIAIGKQYDEQLTEVRAELKVAKDVTIPSLVAAHKLILERLDADTAIAVRNQVALAPRED